ncbi:head-tail adaptor protein [Staphylococcus pasteuri]|nr:head-tail adaptor protein [Staphylococcus pasteuri]
MHYRKGIGTYHKVRYKGQIYNIKSVANDDGLNQTLTIFAIKKE